MRPLLVVAVVLASHLVLASERNPAVVVLPQAEEVKDSADGDAMTTTYLVRDLYPSNEAAAEIHRAMSAAGWTLLREDPNAMQEGVLGETLIQLRMSVEDIGIVDWSDILSGHFAAQLWTDRAGNVLGYTVTRRCGQEAAGLHSVYVTVRTTYITRGQRDAYRERMRSNALEEARRRQELADRVAPLPTPTVTPTPCP